MEPLEKGGYLRILKDTHYGVLSDWNQLKTTLLQSEDTKNLQRPKTLKNAKTEEGGGFFEM